ncbi:Response regulator receiver domain-containing protein [Candidatus Kryptobacter tengchongensis]|uniref:Response regulator receiver domain-containing protein n=3 Tax=Kryptobacter tengchongensis TaxID=1643429 RepID=A0A656D3X4_KRYT1|nr:Response regulator receiver domain-containing protein [Candidatus Kryptobacter tengchongensis]
MPIMDGAEMIKTIKKIDPLVKIIATSGLESPSNLLEVSLQNISGFIQKPYTAITLLKEVAKVLKS